MLAEESSGFMLGPDGYDRRRSSAALRPSDRQDDRSRREDSDAWGRRSSSRFGLAGYGRGGHGPSMVEDLDGGGPPPMPPAVGGWGGGEYGQEDDDETAFGSDHRGRYGIGINPAAVEIVRSPMDERRPR